MKADGTFASLHEVKNSDINPIIRQDAEAAYAAPHATVLRYATNSFYSHTSFYTRKQLMNLRMRKGIEETSKQKWSTGD